MSATIKSSKMSDVSRKDNFGKDLVTNNRYVRNKHVTRSQQNKGHRRKHVIDQLLPDIAELKDRCHALRADVQALRATRNKMRIELECQQEILTECDKNIQSSLVDVITAEMGGSTDILLADIQNNKIPSSSAQDGNCKTDDSILLHFDLSLISETLLREVSQCSLMASNAVKKNEMDELNASDSVYLSGRLTDIIILAKNLSKKTKTIQHYRKPAQMKLSKARQKFLNYQTLLRHIPDCDLITIQKLREIESQLTKKQIDKKQINSSDKNIDKNNVQSNIQKNRDSIAFTKSCIATEMKEMNSLYTKSSKIMTATELLRNKVLKYAQDLWKNHPERLVPEIFDMHDIRGTQRLSMKEAASALVMACSYNDNLLPATDKTSVFDAEILKSPKFRGVSKHTVECNHIWNLKYSQALKFVKSTASEIGELEPFSIRAFTEIWKLASGELTFNNH